MPQAPLGVPPHPWIALPATAPVPPKLETYLKEVRSLTQQQPGPHALWGGAARAGYSKPWTDLTREEQGTVLATARRLGVTANTTWHHHGDEISRLLGATAAAHQVPATYWSSLHASMSNYYGLRYRREPELQLAPQLTQLRTWIQQAVKAQGWDATLATIARDVPHVHGLDILTTMSLPLTKGFDAWLAADPVRAQAVLRPLLSADSYDAIRGQLRVWRRVLKYQPQLAVQMVHTDLDTEVREWFVRVQHEPQRGAKPIADRAARLRLDEIVRQATVLPAADRAALHTRLTTLDAQWVAELTAARAVYTAPDADGATRLKPPTYGSVLWHLLMQWPRTDDQMRADRATLLQLAQLDPTGKRLGELLMHPAVAEADALDILRTQSTAALRGRVARNRALLQRSAAVREALLAEGQSRAVWMAIYGASTSPDEAARIIEWLLQRGHAQAVIYTLRSERRWPLDALPLSAKALKPLLLHPNKMARELAMRILGSGGVEARAVAPLPPRARPRRAPAGPTP